MPVCSALPLVRDRCQEGLEQLGKSRPRDGPNQKPETTQQDSGSLVAGPGRQDTGVPSWVFIEEQTVLMRVLSAQQASRHTGPGARPAAGGSRSAEQQAAMSVTQPAPPTSSSSWLPTKTHWQPSVHLLLTLLTATTPHLLQGPPAALLACSPRCSPLPLPPLLSARPSAGPMCAPVLAGGLCAHPSPGYCSLLLQLFCSLSGIPIP